VNKKSNTKGTEKTPQLTEERVREIVREEIIKREKEIFVPRTAY
jgi:hypothetical protein